MEELILKILEVRNNAYVLHWQTYSNEIHKATDLFQDELGILLDQLVEVYQGKYNKRIKFDGVKNIRIVNHLDNGEIQNYNGSVSFTGVLNELSLILKKEIDSSEMDIQDILLDISNLISKFNYLLSLK